jgi:anti-anti-sigma factor
MGVRRKERSGITVLDISGEFYGDTETDELEAAIDEEIAGGRLHLVLNLTDCAMMNSSALRVMIKAKKACEGKGGAIRICGADQRMKRLLVVVRLYEWFDHYPTEAEAVAAFSKPAQV